VQAKGVIIAGIIRLLPYFSIAVFLAVCWLFRPFVADDAFIVGRYALNAADGLGLVYNAGEQVSALTSPLHALFEVLLAQFTDDPVAAYRIIAPVFPVLGVIIARRIADLDPGESALFFVIALTSPFMALWSVGGLETPMLAGLAAVFGGQVLAISRASVAQRRDIYLLAIFAGLMFLTRFDSVIVTLPVMLSLAVVCRGQRDIWIGGVLALMIALSWLVFSYVFYGDVFPTSAYLKLGQPDLPAKNNIMMVANFLVVSGLILVLPMVRVSRSDTPIRRALLVSVLIAGGLFVAYAFRASGQHMMFGYRFFVPYLPVFGMIILAACGRWRHPLALGFLALNVLVVWVVASVGMNPAPFKRLVGVGPVRLELVATTPSDYGVFISGLKQDAVDLRADWQAKDPDRAAKAFVYTGGIGYWLRDFYIYETLVSYRKNCERTTSLRIAASDYVQQIGKDIVPVNPALVGFFNARRDAATAAQIKPDRRIFLDRFDVIRYMAGPDPIAFKLPARINGRCF